MNDIIIIGGGIAGLYCFYELEKKYKNKNLKISLFEKNNYFGGRILTKQVKVNKKNYQYEMGAGRFNDNHKLMLKLIKELKLEKDMIKISGQSDILPTKDYTLKKKFKDKSSFYYIRKVINLACKEKKEEIIKYSFIEYAKKKLKKDEIDFLLDFSGYYGELIYENAYDAIKLFKEGISDKINYYVLKKGLSSICNKLIKKIKSKNLYLNQELIKIKKFYNTFLLNINGYIYQTRHLILAIPKPSLMKLNYLNEYNKYLNYITCKPLCRIYSVFPDLWFKKINKVTTNSKLRYIIPIDKENGLIMTSYTDCKYAEFWKKYLDLPKKDLDKKLLYELKKIFDFDIKKPIYNSICYWKCGVAYWKPKIESEKISKKILKLNKKDNLYIVGENYSNNQGWNEGAFETVNELLLNYKF